ncbi:MAG: hypothetical protein KC731_37725 [Myxococcales bacterium]|nr:hypothetical protein [Myxococcales bacterium]
MSSFSVHVLERGEVSANEVEAAFENQVLHGGHLGTNLVELGVLDEAGFQELLSSFYDLPLGPAGRLPEVTESLATVLSPFVARLHHVVPLEKTATELRVAASQPLEAAALQAVENRTQTPVAVHIVTPLRLREALSRYAELGISEREQWLLDALNSGRRPQREAPAADVQRRAAALFPAAAPYRRMSEHPEGIVTSSRQPKPRRRALDRATRPETLGDADSGTLQPGESRPTSSDAPERGRITQPYATGAEAEDGEGKRDTQPWRDKTPDGDAPVSMPSEFNRSLSSTPPTDEAKIHEHHRRFRHRGPFTRAQAELAVSQAPDVHMVLEILVRYARQFFERCVVFVVSDQTAVLRLANGFGMEIASLTFPLDEDSLLAEAFQSGDPVVRPLNPEGFDPVIAGTLNVRRGQPVAAIPLCIRERVVAIFYGDDGVDGVDAAAVADVTDFTEICAAEVTRVILAQKR